MTEFSIIIPLHNEQDNVKRIFQEIQIINVQHKYSFEIIFIDDGSTDNTFNVIKNLDDCKCIKLRRNFGQTAATDAGIKAARYNLIVTMDGDGQNDPADIPKLIKFMKENDFDAVSGWRRKRKDPLLKRIFSKGANVLRRIIINDGIHDSGCGLKIYRRECFNKVKLYGEMHRFIPALLKIKGFKVGEIEVNHRPRITGKTKYNWRRLPKSFCDMISVWFWMKFAVRPLHLLGGLGLFLICSGFISGSITIAMFFLSKDLSNTVWPLLTVFFSLTGFQLFLTGLVADMISKTYFKVTDDESYDIEEIIDYEHESV